MRKGKLEGCRYIKEELYLLVSANCTDYVLFSKRNKIRFLLGKEFLTPSKLSFVIIF